MGNEMTVHFGAQRRVLAKYDDFTITTDQSVADGGQASAPEPYDLFLASLATCAGVYVRSFCERRAIATDDIVLRQRWQRADKRIQLITIEIELPPTFPQRYREAVVRAAQQCAVKKTLADPPELAITTVIRGHGEADDLGSA